MFELFSCWLFVLFFTPYFVVVCFSLDDVASLAVWSFLQNAYILFSCTLLRFVLLSYIAITPVQ